MCEWCLNKHAFKHTCGQDRLHAQQGQVDISVARDLAYLALFSGRVCFSVLPKNVARQAATNPRLLLPNPTEAETGIRQCEHRAVGIIWP